MTRPRCSRQMRDGVTVEQPRGQPIEGIAFSRLTHDVPLAALYRR